MINLSVQQEIAYLDLSQRINAFKEIQITQHLIDRVKCLGDDQYITQIIEICEKKLDRGLKLIEFLMQERLWFLSEMQKNEQILLNLIKFLKDYDYSDYSFEEVESICLSQQNEVTQLLSNYYEIFYRINKSLLVDDKTLIYQSGWKENIKEEFAGNTLLKENMNMNLKSSARDIYLFFKRKRTSLRSIVQGGIKHESIIAFIEYLEFFCYELEVRVPLELKVLCNLWIEDILREQTRYEFNITIQSSFGVNYFGKCNTIIFKLQKINFSLDAISNECTKIVANLDNITLPNSDMTENLFIQSDSFNRINKVQQKVHRLLEEAEQIQKNSYRVQFLTLKNPISLERKISLLNINDENIDKLDAAYQGAYILYGEEIEILQEYRQNKIIHFKERIEQLQIQMDGVKLIISKLNDLWLAIRHLRRASHFFQKTAENYKRISTTMTEDNEFSTYEYYQISTEFLHNIFKFQKFHNWLTYLKNSIKSLQPFMRNITEFYHQIEVLLANTQFFLEDVNPNQILIANKIITEHRSKKLNFYQNNIISPVSVQDSQKKIHPVSQSRISAKKLKHTGMISEKNNQKGTAQQQNSFDEKEQIENDVILNSEDEFDLLLEQQAFQPPQIQLFDGIQDKLIDDV